MSTLHRLGAAELRDVVVGYRDALRAHQEAINRLNVYPVPDGDTGTNMALTLEAVVAELDGAAPDMAATCKAISHGSLMGARGNSGVILSQVLRGLASTLAPHESADGPTVAAALQAASDRGLRRRHAPGRGHDPDRGPGGGGGGHRPGRRRRCAWTRCSTPPSPVAGTPSTARPSCWPCCGTRVWSTPAAPASSCCSTPPCSWWPGGRCPSRRPAPLRRWWCPARLGVDEAHAALSALRYEVMYFLEAPDETIPAFKDVWAGIGDSIVVVGGDGLWNCHIHTDDIGAAVEAALDCGVPRKIRVTDLQEQVDEERWVREAAIDLPDPPARELATGVVAVATGDGIRRIFRSLGVHSFVTGGQTMNPSTAQLLEATEATPAGDVILLPNNKNIIPVAEQVDALTDQAGPGRAHPGRGRGLRRPAGLRPRRGRRDQRRGDDRGRRQRRRRRGDPGGPRLDLRRRAHRRGRLARHRAGRDPGRPAVPVRGGDHPPRRPRRRRARDRHRSSRARAPPPPTPAASPSGSPTAGPTSRSRSTTAANPSTPTSSASSRAGQRPRVTRAASRMFLRRR